MGGRYMKSASKKKTNDNSEIQSNRTQSTADAQTSTLDYKQPMHRHRL